MKKFIDCAAEAQNIVTLDIAEIIEEAILDGYIILQAAETDVQRDVCLQLIRNKATAAARQISGMEQSPNRLGLKIISESGNRRV